MDIFIKILLLFTSETINLQDKREDFSEVKFSYSFELQKIPRESDFPLIISLLNKRDTFHLSILKGEEVVANFANRNNNNFADYISALNTELEIGDNVKIIFTIEKSKKENSISIYQLNWFIDYLNSLSFSTFMNIFEEYLHGGVLNLELQDNSSEKNKFQTQTISFSTMNLPNIINKSFREDRAYAATTLCHWDTEKKWLLPEDFYPIANEHENQALIEVFQKVCLLYTTMFIFDYSGMREGIFLYKLNGYKTFGQEIITKKIENITIDLSSMELFYKIYRWIYTGGNTTDKISIARNIISLNYNPETLKISKTAFDAILSNYKIYERQNVKQYIEVRNKLSEILIDLQCKLDKIVDGFTSDYKKNIITLLSFFISVIVIRVVSKGDFIGGFTNEIIILSYSFLVISIGLFIYSRWEFSRRVKMFDKHYEQLKERYKELLSTDELNKIFDECNPKNRKEKSFVHQQKKCYSVLWISSILVLGLAITIIFFMNNIGVCNIIRLILCCIKNM